MLIHPKVRETRSLLQMFIRLIVARPGPGLVILIGMAGLTAIVVSLFTIANAFEVALTATGKPDRALLLRAGSTSEINGNVALEQFSIVRDLPEVHRAVDVAEASNVALASRETYITVKLPTKHSTTEATLPLRGVEEAALRVRPEVEFVQGAMLSSGKFELVAGVKAAERMAGLGVGETIHIRGQAYRVTGHFAAAGTATEMELWVDERLLAQQLGRGDTFSSILVQLNHPEQLTDLQNRLAADRRLTLTAHRESDYYQQLAAPTTGLIRGLGLLVGAIMALGAVVAAINSMQTALQSRTREIATLRALGFHRTTILTAVLAECTLLACTGAGVALLGVYWLADGSTLSTVAAATTSGNQVAFDFRLNSQAVSLALFMALGLGIFGGLIPGVGAIRKPLPDALRT